MPSSPCESPGSRRRWPAAARCRGRSGRREIGSRGRRPCRALVQPESRHAVATSLPASGPSGLMRRQIDVRVVMPARSVSVERVAVLPPPNISPLLLNLRRHGNQVEVAALCQPAAVGSRRRENLAMVGQQRLDHVERRLHDASGIVAHDCTGLVDTVSRVVSRSFSTCRRISGSTSSASSLRSTL